MVEGAGGEEGKHLLHQLLVGALEVAVGGAVGGPGDFRKQQLPLQGALKYQTVKAGQSRGKGEGGGEVEVGGDQGNQLNRETDKGGVIRDRLGGVLIFGKISTRCHP